jgi:hypothetical protein
MIRDITAQQSAAAALCVLQDKHHAVGTARHPNGLQICWSVLPMSCTFNHVL